MKLAGDELARHFIGPTLQPEEVTYIGFWNSWPEELDLNYINIYLGNLFPENYHLAEKFDIQIAKTFARYRGHLGPPGPKLEKESENEFPGPLSPGAQKVENGVEKESKSTVFQLF